MKRTLFIAAFATLFAACQQQPQGPTQAEYDQLMAERDSLAGHMTELQDIIGGVSTSLDSIDSQEGLIFVNNEDGSRATKKQILERIHSYKDLLARQREQLAELEKQQKSAKGSIRELKTIIGRLRQEIFDKEQRIAQLESDLTSSKKNVADLQTNLAKSQELAANNANERDALQKVATAQDQVINTGYYIVGSASELKNLGFIKGVFKKKADYANLDESKFTRVDIREFSELVISGREPKLITDKPTSSYHLVDNGNGTWTLKITNPAIFWQASQFLIIQSK